MLQIYTLKKKKLFWISIQWNIYH